MRAPSKSSVISLSGIPFSQCPAKTYKAPDGTIRPGRTVLEHCLIVGEVARALLQRYPQDLQQRLFPGDAPFAAACHDIGKVSPCFFEKLRKNFTVGTHELPSLAVNSELEKEWGGHAGVSQVSAAALGAPRWVPEILGQHHGFSPQIAGKRADAEQFGGPCWQEQRAALVAELKRRLAMSWPQLQSVAQARAIAGLTSVADWIGSGEYFEDPDRTWADNIEKALDHAGFIPPSYRKGLSFNEVFDFAPRLAQTRLIEAITGPGVYVLEAPMGLGKTEAALYAAYHVLQQGQASGIYFALPTQLTSNKIFERFNAFLERVLAEDCTHRSLLLHSKAWLLETEMGEEGRPGGAWFNHAKRGLLAPFAVGTIDQALMAAMNVKHGFVRAFGLVGKVVILDEVHSYDAYTGTLLDAAVKLLRSLRCTVIILSATLNQQRRSQLLECKLRGCGYPLITAIPDGECARELDVASDTLSQVTLQIKSNDGDAILEALGRAAQGQQVLWIENTVKDAQLRFLDVAARAADLGIACGLLHSRFIASDRLALETRWVDLFGKGGRQKRPEQGRILIGTQVLEQSLDIDADFLITRFAPTDMLLQRLGRLWRHTQTPRPSNAICEAWLLAPPLDPAVENPKSAFGSSAFVYSPYVLCRSLEVWHKRRQITLPHDIRPLIEQTYVERDESGAMRTWLDELNNGTGRRKGRLALQQLARIGLADGGKTLPEAQAQTRYSESDNFEVLLLRELQQLPEQKQSRIVLLDGRELILPWQWHKWTKAQWKTLTVLLMQQLVLVRPEDAPSALSRGVLEKYGLQHCFYLGDPSWKDDESVLRVALVDNSDSLRGLHGARAHQQLKLEYRADLGYRLIKH